MQFCIFMRRSVIAILMGVALFALTGCDFFRTLAGRPTSAEIETRQVELIAAQKAELQAKYDELQAEMKSLKDSLNALDSIRQLGGSVLNPTKLGSLFATKVEARYYVIVGAFKTRYYAEKLVEKAAHAGYAPALISFRNGNLAVGLCPANNITDAFEALKKVKKESFCPSDVWILLNE